MKTMAQRIDESLAPRRFSTTLLAVFAVLAAGLAAIGIYGVIAFLVEQGTKEVGIRMALGASPRSIGLLVLRHGMALAVPAVIAGTAGALVLTRLLRSLLFGIGTADAVTYAAVVTLVLVTALAASYLPAQRAAKLDPVQTLR
jgi:ABC-type antimicrobial peptide transport system permease subunit